MADKVLNSCILLIVFMIFSIRMFWVIPETFNGFFSTTKFMLSNLIIFVFLTKFLIFNTILMINYMKLWLDPSKVLNLVLLNKLKSIITINDAAHHILLIMFLFVTPIDWLCNRIGIFSKIKITKIK